MNLKNLNISGSKPDIISGLILSTVLIPQSMAYAMLAGLPPVYGLYGSTLPVIAYGVFGSSRHLSLGPVAVISLISFSACSAVADPNSADFIRAASVLTLMAAAGFLFLGIIRAGFLINFISRAVMSGFISAAAVIIILSQAGAASGAGGAAGSSFIALVKSLSEVLSGLHFLTLAVFSGSLLIIILSAIKLPGIPGPLIVLTSGIITAYLLNLQSAGVAVVGKVPAGLPGFSLPGHDTGVIPALMPAALIIVFIGYVESMGISQWAAAKDKYRVHPDRELIGLGMANLFSGFFAGIPVAGGFSRTALNYNAGARTKLSCVFAALFIGISLVLLAPVFYYLPRAALAAVVAVAAAGLIDYRYAAELFRLKKTDGWILLTTFLVTLFAGIPQGIISGVIVSLGVFARRSSRPRISVLGKTYPEGIYRDKNKFPDARVPGPMIIIRADASFYFANINFVLDRINLELARRTHAKTVILDMTGVNDIDGVAASALGMAAQDLKLQGIQLVFSGAKKQIRDVLDKTSWYDSSGQSFPDIDAAVNKFSE